MATETELMREAIKAQGGVCDDLPDNLQSTLLKKLIETCAAGGGGGGGGGLPTGGEPHQQLVTDKDGNAKWEDRKFYSEQIQGEVLPETELMDTGEGMFALLEPPTTMPVVGVNHTVVYNGTSYDCVAVEYSADDGEGNNVPEAVVLGNTGAIIGEPDPTGPLFVLMIVNAPEEGMYGMGMALDGSETFTISVNINGEYTKKIDDKYLDINEPFVVTLRLSNAFNSGYSGSRDDVIYLSHTESEVLEVLNNTNRPIFCHVIANESSPYEPEQYILPLVRNMVNKNTKISFEYMFTEGGLRRYSVVYYMDDSVKTHVDNSFVVSSFTAGYLDVSGHSANDGLRLRTTSGKIARIQVSDDGQMTATVIS